VKPGTHARGELADHLEPEVTDGRLARQWASVERRLPAPRRGVSAVRVAMWLAPALAVGLWFGWPRHARPLGSGAILESSDTPLTVQLRDGSSLELAAQTRLRVLRDQPSAVELEIGDGRANFDVKHVKGRSFDVRAGVVSVHVVGTQFQVVKASRREGMEIQVAVKRGVVEVQRSDRGGDTRRIAAGETWSVWVPAQPVAPLSALAPPPAAAAVPASLDEPRPSPAHPPASPELTGLGEVAPLSEVAEPKVRASRVSPAVSAQPAESRAQSVRELFLRANVARRAGRMQDAADAYAEVLKRFPRDSRAGVSAFELGRIRMDALGDPKGAASAFADALRLSHRAEVREDALARLAIAGDALGDRDMCQKARARYLADYPSGVHAGSLTPLCPAIHP
jgi:TolA-binding protein